MTASKAASQIEANWSPDKPFYLDGTIDKQGSRHTDIGVEIDEADIAALANAFFRNWAEQRDAREMELIVARKRIENAESAMRKLHKLSWQSDRAPSVEAFGEAVRAIVNHYESLAGQPEAEIKPPNLKWIKWNTL